VGTTIRLAFDIDGVVAEADIGLFRTADRFSKEIQQDIYSWTMREANLLLNPVDFLVFPDDEYYLITSRSKELTSITKKWVKKYCPHVKKLIVLGQRLLGNTSNKKEIEEWLDTTARDKAEVINKYKIEVYFDDSTYVVKRLRELCPNCKIINYGGRV